MKKQEHVLSKLDVARTITIQLNFFRGGYAEAISSSIVLGAMDCRVEAYWKTSNFGCDHNVATVELSFSDGKPPIQCSSVSIPNGQGNTEGHSERRALALAINQAIKDNRTGFAGLPSINFSSKGIPDFTSAKKQLEALKATRNIQVFTERAPCLQGTPDSCAIFLNTILTGTNHQVYYLVPPLSIAEIATKYHNMDQMLLNECDNVMDRYIQIKEKELQRSIEARQANESIKSLAFISHAQQMKLLYLQERARLTKQEIEQLNRTNVQHDSYLHILRTKSPVAEQDISTFEGYKIDNQKKIERLNGQLQRQNQDIQRMETDIRSSKEKKTTGAASICACKGSRISIASKTKTVHHVTRSCARPHNGTRTKRRTTTSENRRRFTTQKKASYINRTSCASCSTTIL